MVNLTFGFSLQKTARTIAIVDIVYCFLSVIVRTSLSVVQAAYAVQVVQINLNQNESRIYPPPQITNVTVDNKTTINNTKISSESLQPLYPSPNHYGAINDPEEFAVDIGNLFFFLLLLMIGTMGYIIFELWMCRLLLGAAKNLDKENCKRWWWYRLAMSIILLFLCIVLTLVVSRGWFSWLLELVIFYRAYELVVIHQFKNEIDSISSRTQIRNSPQ